MKNVHFSLLESVAPPAERRGAGSSGLAECNVFARGAAPCYLVLPPAKGAGQALQGIECSISKNIGRSIL